VNVKDTTEIIKESTKNHSSHSKKVFLTKETLLKDINYEVIGKIEVGIGGAGFPSMESVYASMANQAREFGADAVVEIRTWRQPSLFSWASPHGSGKAIKLVDKMDFSKLNGEWR
jgi:hypothetical protein